MKDVNLLDRILQRADLKQETNKLNKEIDELNSEIEELQDKLDKRTKEKKEAITNEQEAYRERNKLEDKVSQLQDKISNLEEDDENPDWGFKNKRIKGKNIENVYEILNNIEYDERVAITCNINKKNSIPELISNEDLNYDNISKNDLVLIGEYGLIRHAIDLPIKPKTVRHEERSFSIREDNFYPVGEITFGLLRSDIFALGLYDGWERKELRTIESNVNNNHSKGGFSQSRFENRRDEQINEHIDDVRDLIGEFDTETKIIVGEEQIIKQIEDSVNYTDTSGATGSPEDALSQAFNEFWNLEIKRI